MHLPYGLVHRHDLDSLSSVERTELADLIRNHVTQAVLDEHEAWHQIHRSGGTEGTGSGERFLAFHRNFIGKLEDNLISQGKNQYVPLPTWNPKDPIPSEFSHPGRSTSNPQKQLPTWATESGGSDRAPIFNYTSLGQFQSSDELGRSLGDNFHGSVHTTIGGDMSSFRSPRDPIFYPWHAFLDDLWSTWEDLRATQPTSPNTPTNTQNNGGRCFIATAAYGSELAPPVQFLRDFRDDVVLQSKFQRTFEKILNVYYSFSPSIANLMKQNKPFKYMIKYSVVWPFVALARATAFVVKPFVRQKQSE